MADTSLFMELSEDDWDQAVRRGPLVAGFWAEWCVPSRALPALLEAAARDFAGSLQVGLVDHDANPVLVEGCRIQGLPTVLLLVQGAEVDRRVGLMDRPALDQMLARALRR